MKRGGNMKKWLLNKLGLVEKRQLDEWKAYASTIEKWIYEGRDITCSGQSRELARMVTVDLSLSQETRVILFNAGHVINAENSSVLIHPDAKVVYFDDDNGMNTVWR
jgi:hypothetical protein